MDTANFLKRSDSKGFRRLGFSTPKFLKSLSTLTEISETSRLFWRNKKGARTKSYTSNRI